MERFRDIPEAELYDLAEARINGTYAGDGDGRADFWSASNLADVDPGLFWTIARYGGYPEASSSEEDVRR